LRRCAATTRLPVGCPRGCIPSPSTAPNGVVPSTFWPDEEGEAFTFKESLKPLEPFRSQVNVLTGLSNAGENGHSPSTAMWLSGTFPAKGSVIHLNTTVDQIIAQHVGQGTTFPSIELATEDHSSHLGSCAGDFLCSYMSTISWRTPTQPLPMEINPRVVFERMFGDGGSPAQRLAQVREDRSILDSVKEAVAGLERRLGAGDRVKVAEYLDSMREIERRIQVAERQSGESLISLPDRPIGVPENYDEHAKLMFDLAALAFQADITRIATMMIAREGSTRTYPEIGVADPHHPLTHHRNNPEWIEKVTQINEFHMGLFSKFIQKLASTPDGDGTLLDHSMIVYGSGIADGNKHTHLDLPVLLVGNGGGALAPGRHIRYDKDTPMTNLYMTLLDRMGVRPESIGDSTGLVQHLANV
jgi:hypothetical protein